MTTRIAFLLSAALGFAATQPAAADPFRTTFVSLGQGQPALLYEPEAPGPRAAIGVFAMHDNGDYLRPSPSNPCSQLATRGYRVLCANASTAKSGFFSDDDFDKILLNVKAGVAHLRTLPAVKTVVLFGHSGGGEMMAAYQNLAENGVAACRGPRRIHQCPDSLGGMPATDGIMMIDAVMGGPVSTLISLDPAVIDDDDGKRIDPTLDMYNPANGYDPKGATYSEAFRKRFFAAQGARMNRLVAKAQARLAAIETGRGKFEDDEVFVIAGAMGAMNRLNVQDLSFMSSTHAAWPLLHRDGRVTTEVIRSVRVPRTMNVTANLTRGAITTTVRKFLNTWAVRTAPDYRYDATDYHGIDYQSNYINSVDSVPGITKPLLQMGMTGSYEFFAAEQVRAHARSADMTLAYVEGALHGFAPCKECAVAKGLGPDGYGDTVKTLFDYIDGWLSRPGRFIAGAR